MRIGTWNLRGILLAEKQQQLANDLNTYNIHILAVQETHIRGTGTLNLPKPNTNTTKQTNQYTLYYTGPTDTSHHSVGVIVRNDCNAKFNRIDDRICTLTIDLEETTDKNKRKLTIISAYAPTLTNSVPTLHPPPTPYTVTYSSALCRQRQQGHSQTQSGSALWSNTNTVPHF